MNIVIVTAIAAGALVALAGGFVAWRKLRPRKLNPDHFQAKWQELQKLLRDRARWGEAVLEADGLLDEALKKKHVKGRNMGARLVKAQREFSDNDALWFGHKLRTKLDADPKTKLKQTEVKQALTGIRQALKDIGALR